jgi:cyclophilin family peptidyl-prolyl cis-trans isomerase
VPELVQKALAARYSGRTPEIQRILVSVTLSRQVLPGTGSDRLHAGRLTSWLHATALQSAAAVCQTDAAGLHEPPPGRPEFPGVLMPSFRFFPATVLALSLAFPTLASAAERLTITLKSGDVVIELADDVAPLHAARLKALADAGEYDNVAFHRVIEGFMAQTGDVEFGDMEDGFAPRRAGMGGSSQPDLNAEFSDKFPSSAAPSAWPGRRIRTPPTRSSSSCSPPAPHLNGQYTVVGNGGRGHGAWSIRSSAATPGNTGAVQ